MRDYFGSLRYIGESSLNQHVVMKRNLANRSENTEGQLAEISEETDQES